MFDTVLYSNVFVVATSDFYLNLCAIYVIILVE